MPSTAALNPAVVVMHGMDLCTAAVRIAQPSCLVPRPTGVLITRLITPSLSISTIVGSPSGPRPSEFLRTLPELIPLSARKSAVPPVDKRLKPKASSALAGSMPDCLSLSASEINTEPETGSGPKALI